MVEKLFLTVPNDTCFECGKIRLAIVSIDGYAFMPCFEENCPYEEKTKHLGVHKLDTGEEYDIYLRKVAKQ